MCQGWGKPEDRNITLRGCNALWWKHGGIICHHNCYVGSKRASLLGNKHLLTSKKQKTKINENIELEYVWRSEFSAVRLSSLLGFRRPELHFWQSHWSLSEKGTGCFPALFLIFSSCEIEPLIWISYKIYWWKIWHKNWCSLLFPTQTQAVMLFPNIFSEK